MWLIALVLAYFIGGLPSGFLITKVITGEDVRASGSGSTGATNVVRKVGLGAGLATYVLDVAKSILAIWLAARWFGLSSPAAQGAVGLAAVLGHIFPVYLGFRGGKGVAVGVGVFLMLSPLATLLSLAVWAVTFMLTRTVSLGSMLGVLALPFAVWLSEGWWLGRPPAVWRETLVWSIVIGLLIVLRHWSNLRRLLQGTELTFRKTRMHSPPGT
ncbi:MAG: glycerol-3-phosphate 1-O-acyltransferase PlsY [Acidobacteriota bacterium]